MARLRAAIEGEVGLAEDCGLGRVRRQVERGVGCAWWKIIVKARGPSTTEYWESKKNEQKGPPPDPGIVCNRSGERPGSDPIRK